MPFYRDTIHFLATLIFFILSTSPCLWIIGSQLQVINSIFDLDMGCTKSIEIFLLDLLTAQGRCPSPPSPPHLLPNPSSKTPRLFCPLLCLSSSLSVLPIRWFKCVVLADEATHHQLDKHPLVPLADAPEWRRFSDPPLQSRCSEPNIAGGMEVSKEVLVIS